MSPAAAILGPGPTGGPSRIGSRDAAVVECDRQDDGDPEDDDCGEDD